MFVCCTSMVVAVSVWLQAHNCCCCHEQLPATAASSRHYIVQRSLGVVGVGGVRCAQFEFFLVHLSDV